MENKEIKNKILEIVGADSLYVDAHMYEHTSFRVGGPADFLVFPETIDQLLDLLALCKNEDINYYLMGNGSNLLVSDKGFRGVIIKTKAINAIEVEKNKISIETGAMLRKVADVALGHGLTGMEFASGIPGSIGGAVVMNAGAYGGEMKDIVESVDVIKDDGKICTLSAEECDFGYRHSSIRANGWVVVRVNVRLSDGEYSAVKAMMKDYNGRRRDKQPLEYPSAGSTFKRPEGYFAGKLIQDAGMKGYTVGGAQVSEKHSGFVINFDHATAADVKQVIHDVQDAVKTQFGVSLETEVIMIGE